MQFNATHKGWILFCPVYFSNIDGVAPGVMERHPFLAPVLSLCNFLVISFARVRYTLTGDEQASFPLYITGECKKTITF